MMIACQSIIDFKLPVLACGQTGKLRSDLQSRFTGCLIKNLSIQSDTRFINQTCDAALHITVRVIFAD